MLPKNSRFEKGVLLGVKCKIWAYVMEEAKGSIYAIKGSQLDQKDDVL